MSPVKGKVRAVPILHGGAGQLTCPGGPRADVGKGGNRLGCVRDQEAWRAVSMRRCGKEAYHM
jgi:hypothetical protein